MTSDTTRQFDMATLRITPDQVNLITRSIQRHLGSSARIWLFGSRLDNRKRGGDLDLYVEADPQPILLAVRCKVELEEKLDLPVDLIVRGYDDASPIALFAKQEGRPL